MEKEELSIDDRITNLQAIISVAEYEIAQLLKQKERHKIGFTIPEKTDVKKRQTKQ